MMIRFKVNLGEVIGAYERDYLRARNKELRVNLHRLDKIDRGLGTLPVLMNVDIEKFLKRFKSAANRNRYRTLLHGVVQWGIDMSLAEASFTEMRAFKKEREKGARTRRMTPDEETRLREAMGSDLSDLFTAAVDTGLRYGALRRLQVRDVGEGTLNVPAQIQKTQQSQRIPLTRRLGEIVDRRIEGKSPDDHVFTVANFWNEWNSSRARAGVSGLHWHDLRGEFASRLSEAGVGIETISRLLGHATVKETMRYLRPRISQFDEAIRKLGL